METRTEAINLDEALRANHLTLEKLAGKVLDSLHAGHRDQIRAAWGELENALLGHLEVEERFVLPAFALGFPREAARFRREHRELREALVELGIQLDLHELREDAAARFLRRLKDHAASEDSAFYVWALAHVPEAAPRSFIARLRGLLRGEPHTRRPPIFGAVRAFPASCASQ